MLISDKPGRRAWTWGAWLGVFLLALTACGGDQEEQEARKDGSLVKSGVSAVVSGVKNTAAGIVEGVDEGRQSGRSLDGALLVASRADFEKLLAVQSALVEERGPGTYAMTLALRNEGEQPVRLINLDQDVNVVVLDADGFAYALPRPLEQGQDFTVLPRSAARFRLVFERLELKPATLRLYGLDLPLPAPVKAQSPEPAAESSSAPTEG
ncbi:MAG: hypothetical protein LBU12_08575 [Deltaproteobacteria bacterium]|jgi:hypothetical protein|nr:hypothetical protein [Deltaproteobacteria bacterium]